MGREEGGGKREGKGVSERKEGSEGSHKNGIRLDLSRTLGIYGSEGTDLEVE